MVGFPSMRKIRIAFDVDGTLRKNSEERHRRVIEPNERIVALLEILARFKNVEIHVWSNRGAEYCEDIVEELGLRKIKQCHLKTWVHNRADGDGFVPDIAIDDQQRFDGAALNLIVREK